VAYNLLVHIVRSICFSDWEKTYVAMFTACFDASGTKRMPVLTFAGYVSRVNKWESFEKEWAKILERYRVGLFHMTDFASSEGSLRTGEGQHKSVGSS
jgi:hypothetical protein